MSEATIATIRVTREDIDQGGMDPLLVAIERRLGGGPRYAIDGGRIRFDNGWDRFSAVLPRDAIEFHERSSRGEPVSPLTFAITIPFETSCRGEESVESN